MITSSSAPQLLNANLQQQQHPQQQHQHHHPHQQQQQHYPGFQFLHGGARHTPPTLIDMALDLLPQDFELVPLLQSPQMQMAWFNHLSVVRGSKEASLFKDLIINLQQNPEMVTNVKQQLLARKLLSSAGPAEHAMPPPPPPPPPFMQHLHCPPPPPPPQSLSQPPPQQQQQQHQQQPSKINEKPPILAQDLEAMLLRESRQSSGPPPPFMTSSPYLDSLLEETTSLNEVLKNDPILSEILHQSDESSPDSGCWGSVNSILNSKLHLDSDTTTVTSRFTELSKQQNVAESSRTPVGTSGYVPLYLRRAGMSTSSDETGNNENRKIQHQLPQDTAYSFVGRFTQEPVGFYPPSQLQREMSSSTDPFVGSSSFTGSSSLATSSTSTSSSSSTSSSKPPLTYANVLRNPQLLRESNDPLTRIRNLGTQGNRELDREPSGSNQQQPRLFSYFGGGQW
jgi:hypothetical protein